MLIEELREKGESVFGVWGHSNNTWHSRGGEVSAKPKSLFYALKTLNFAFRSKISCLRTKQSDRQFLFQLILLFKGVMYCLNESSVSKMHSKPKSATLFHIG